MDELEIIRFDSWTIVDNVDIEAQPRHDLTVGPAAILESAT